MTADKLVPRLPVALFTMPTGRTGLGGVAWVHRHHQNPFTFGLVSYEGAHLIERPSLESTALGFPSCCPGPYACEVFTGDSRAGVFGFGDQSVTNAMIFIGPHARFPQTDFVQLPLGTLRACSLARSTHTPAALAARFNGIAAKVFAVIRCCQVLDAQIDANDLAGRVGIWRSVYQYNMQKEHAIPPFDKRGAPRMAARQLALLVGTKHGVKMRSGVQERQTEGPISLPEAEDTLVVVHRGRRKGRVGFLGNLERSTDTRNGPNRQIGRQPKAAADFSVAGMLDDDFVARMDLTSYVRNVVAGIGKGHQRRVEFNALLWGRRKFAGNRANGVHSGHYITCEYQKQLRLKPWKAFPPLPINRRGFHGLKPRFL